MVSILTNWEDDEGYYAILASHLPNPEEGVKLLRRLDKHPDFVLLHRGDLAYACESHRELFLRWAFICLDGVDMRDYPTQLDSSTPKPVFPDTLLPFEEVPQVKWDKSQRRVYQVHGKGRRKGKEEFLAS